MLAIVEADKVNLARDAGIPGVESALGSLDFVIAAIHPIQAHSKVNNSYKGNATVQKLVQRKSTRNRTGKTVKTLLEGRCHI